MLHIACPHCGKIQREIEYWALYEDDIECLSCTECDYIDVGLNFILAYLELFEGVKI